MEAALAEELGEIALAKLMGFSNKDLAQRFKCTERRIERKLHAIRLAWEHELPVATNTPRE